VTVARDELVGVVLAAGAGTRLRPLTLERPKAMCPVGNVPLVDRAIARVAPYVRSIAVNAHVSQSLLVEHVRGRAHVSIEDPHRLATAGAVGHLRAWIEGAPVLLHNADTLVDDDLSALLDGWTGERPRLLVRDVGGPSDFGHLHYLGISLLPGPIAARMPDARAGLYDLVWHPAHERGELETVQARGVSIDCGTPADYLRANLHVSGGVSVIADDAVVEGRVTRCVVWPGARVEADEDLVDVIRTPHVTVDGSPRQG
jgi:NDP-sugar pyrophosphorylase family protein